VVLHDARARCWLHFHEPVEVVVARTPEEVLPLVRRVEQRVEGEALHAAGFLSYEAAPGFDSALKVRTPEGFPLAWFGLYRAPEVLRELPPALPEACCLDALTFCTSKPDYLQAIAAIRRAIRDGETYQVNHTVRLRGKFGADPWWCFLALVEAQQAAYCAFVDLAGFAVASASPESFFELEGDMIRCRPMKGTLPRGRWPEEDAAFRKRLARSAKDRAENVMIVDMVRNDLGRIAETGSVRVDRLFEVERYPTVWQLTSTVTARTRQPVSEILRALFPSASVTGAPKARTMGIIGGLEDSPRGIYTGSIGFLSPGRRAQFNVAIRTLTVNKRDRVAEYGTGGGIVWDSVAEDEYRECEAKTAVLRRTVRPFSLLETLRWEPGKGYFLLEEHLARLTRSAEYFGYALARDALWAQLEALGAGLPAAVHKVRLLVDRQGEVSLEAEPLAPNGDAPVRLVLAREPVDPALVFIYHKTTQRDVYEHARTAVAGGDDVLLWNTRGEVTETTVANVVLDLDGAMVTPPLSCGLLPGIMREWLLRSGVVREKVVAVSDLVRCRRLWVVNSVRLWRAAEISPEAAARLKRVK